MAFFDKVKDFANDAANTLTSAAKDVSDSVSNSMEKSKVKNNINAEEQKIIMAYRKIGEKFYKDNQTAPVGYEQFYSEIATAKANSENLQEQLKNMQ